MIENIALKGLLSMIGSFMISLAVGLMYLWGIITVYATSYFRIVTKSQTLTEQITDIVFPLTLLGQALAMPLAARFVRKTSARINCMIAGAAMACCMYMSSYCQSFQVFVIIYGLFSGLIIGIIYIIPIAHCHQFFPKKKSSVSIILVSASGVGTLIFAFIGFNMMNLKNLSVMDTQDGFYGVEQAMIFPQYLRALSWILLVLISGGGLLLFQYPRGYKKKEQIQHKKGQQNDLANLMNHQFTLEIEQNQDQPKNPFGTMNYEMAFVSKGFENGKVYGQRDEREFWPSLNIRQSQKYLPPDSYDKTADISARDSAIQSLTNECPRTRDGPKQLIFWKIFIIILCGTNFGLMISNNYKTYVKHTIRDQRFLVTVGALAAVSASFSRFIWAFMLERMSFKVVYSMLCVINAFLAFTVFYIKSVEVVYFAYVVAAYICYGGHLGIFPALVAQVFGIKYGPQIYGIMFLAFPCSNFLQYVFINMISTNLGFWLLFMISGGMSVAAFVISNRMTFKYDWSDRIRQNNERKRLEAR